MIASTVAVLLLAAQQDVVYPVSGQITTEYSAPPGHSALDISSGSPELVDREDRDGNGFAEYAGNLVYASAAGRVTRVQDDYERPRVRPYGKRVEITHANGYLTGYAHLSSISAGYGSTIPQGRSIGREGNTGNVRGSTGLHLHWYLKRNGTYRELPGSEGAWVTAGRRTGISIGDAPGWQDPEFAKMFTPPDRVADVTCRVASGSVLISWSEAARARSYTLSMSYFRGGRWQRYYEWPWQTATQKRVYPAVRSCAYKVQVWAVNGYGAGPKSREAGFYMPGGTLDQDSLDGRRALRVVEAQERLRRMEERLHPEPDQERPAPRANPALERLRRLDEQLERQSPPRRSVRPPPPTRPRPAPATRTPRHFAE